MVLSPVVKKFGDFARLNLRYLVTSMSPSHSSVQIRASGAPVRFRAPEERLTTNPTFWPDNSIVRGSRTKLEGGSVVLGD
jgi:hypothetical protein